MMFGGPPDKKPSAKQDHNPIYGMNDDRRPWPSTSLVFVFGPPVKGFAAFIDRATHRHKHACYDLTNWFCGQRVFNTQCGSSASCESGTKSIIPNIIGKQTLAARLRLLPLE